MSAREPQSTALGKRAQRVRKYLVWAAALALAVVLMVAPLPWQHSTHIHTVAEFARPPSEVFEYVTTPGNWPKWHPSSLAVRGSIDHSLETGEQVTEDFLVAGRRGQVVWTVIDRQPDRRWVIEGQVAGGGRGTVRYTLTPTDSGTRFERDFDYSFNNLLLMILDQIQIRARVDAESTEALRRLKGDLERSSFTPG